jgi:hypothetical protein
VGQRAFEGFEIRELYTARAIFWDVSKPSSEKHAAIEEILAYYSAELKRAGAAVNKRIKPLPNVGEMIGE